MPFTTSGQETEWALFLQPQKQGKKSHKYKRETENTDLANRTIYILIWYVFYDLRPETEWALFSQP